MRRSPCGERGLKYPAPCNHMALDSRSPCGERGLKCATCVIRHSAIQCRSPCGERGLKLVQYGVSAVHAVSLPVRGAWIETRTPRLSLPTALSLPVRGAWIETIVVDYYGREKACRSPCGERGLKQRAGKHYPIKLRRSPCGERGLKQFASYWKGFCPRRSPCGERGLKPPHCISRESMKSCRSPCGERGLKHRRQKWVCNQDSVAPRAGSVD